MAAISDFYHDCNIMADTSDIYDTILGPLPFYSYQCYKNALITVKITLAVKGLNTRWRCRG